MGRQKALGNSKLVTVKVSEERPFRAKDSPRNSSAYNLTARYAIHAGGSGDNGGAQRYACFRRSPDPYRLKQAYLFAEIEEMRTIICKYREYRC